MIEWARIEAWQYVIDSVASEYHRKFNDIDIEDIRQSLYQWFVEHPNKLDAWEAIGHKDAKNLIYRSLRNQALDYCQHWKAKSGGYEASDVFYYEASMVEALLPAVLRKEHGTTAKLNLAGPSGTSAPNEGGNLMAMMIEVDWGFWKLGNDDRKILFLRHAESLDFAQIAKELELGTDDAARMRHKRAVRKLINKIGGFKPFVDEDLDSSTQQESEAEHSSRDADYSSDKSMSE
jgi:DNA-directed RNA polymerase specialized sigma24 family protein